MHDASAFAVTLETKLHRPTDLQACVEEEGLGLVDWMDWMGCDGGEDGRRGE